MQLEYMKGRVFMGRLKKGSDLLLSLTEKAQDLGIRAGIVWGIGAVQNLVYGFYAQEEKRYYPLRIDKPLEVLSFLGNVSQRDQKTFIHAHVTVSDEQGKAFGGHLMEGSKVFAFEYSILELLGPELDRCYDEETGLFLWKENP